LEITLPIHNPVAEFAILILIALVFPILFKKLKIPGIVGLIIAGMIVGPHGINLINRDDSIIMLGSIGLLYILFIAGLDLDIKKIKANKNYSVTFGFATFFIPLILGMLLTYQILNYDIFGSLIISLMFSTHTLVAYPIAIRLGITQTRSTSTVVGGTIITDTAVIILFGIIMNYYHGSLSVWFWTKFLTLLFATALFIFIAIPKIALWFFKNIEEENYSQFTFVLAMFLLASMLTEIAGVEPIVGAFLAGLAFSKLIPHNSVLMNRLHLVGNGLFIPLFLINVGMIIDLKVLTNGYYTLLFTAILTSMALISKYLAAKSMRIFFKFNKIETDYIFGLSASHAAATIAIITIGYQAGILDDRVLNGTVLLILVTSIVASFVTERAGRRLAIEEQSRKMPDELEPLRILVPCSNPNTLDKLLDLAVACRGANDTEQPIFPLSVIVEDETHYAQIHQSTKTIENLVKIIYPGKYSITPTTRLDTNVSNGIIRAVKEIMINLVILGWTGKSKASEFFFGRKTDNVIEGTNKTVMVAKLHQMINLTNKIFVILPENAQYEVGFKRFLEILENVSKYAASEVIFICFNQTKNAIISYCRTAKILVGAKFEPIANPNEIKKHFGKFTDIDLIFIVKGRTKSVSYSWDYTMAINNLFDEKPDLNFILTYPETNPITDLEEITHPDVLDASFIEENITLYQKIKSIFSKKSAN